MPTSADVTLTCLNCGAKFWQAAGHTCPVPVTRAEYDALRADVQALARVLTAGRADAPFTEADRNDAYSRVRTLAEGKEA